MNANRPNRSAVTLPTEPTAREMLPTVGLSLAVLGAAMALHWIATVLQ
jgi:hypothetical protein